MVAHPARGGKGAADAASYTITLSPSGDSVVCRHEDTVLSAILVSGAQVVFGCRGGGCGTCKMRVISGTVEHGRCSAAVLLQEENKYRGPRVGWPWLGPADRSGK